MNAPGEFETPPSETPDPGVRAAVVVDQLELFRLGVERVLDELDVQVVASSVRAGEGLRVTRSGAADLLIVGRHADLKPQHALREAKRQKKSLRVVLLLEQAESPDVARLVGMGADALLLRSISALDLKDAIQRVIRGERVVASALAVGTLGRVGPSVEITQEEAVARSGLSPKELEVLAELAQGLTYKQIANEMIITQATVKTHLVHIYAKLGVSTRHEAVSRALALGLLS